MKWLKQYWFKVGILIVLTLFAVPPAYYFLVYAPQMNGVSTQASASEFPGFQMESSTTPNVNAPTQANTSDQPPAAAQNSPQSTPSGSVATNSAPCEQIATEAAQNEQSQANSQGDQNTTTVNDAYYTSYVGNRSDCFYELTTDYSNDTVVTAIHYAPNDALMAECDEPYGQSSQLTCTQQESFGNSDTINQSTFQLIEAELFTN